MKPPAEAVLVRHGPVSYRLKDYYDLWVLFSRNKVNGDVAVAMLKKTFSLFKKWELPSAVEEIEALSEANVAAQERNWAAERKAKRFGIAPPSSARWSG